MAEGTVADMVAGTIADMAVGMGMAEDTISARSAEGCTAEATMVESDRGICTKGSRLGSMGLQASMDRSGWEP